MPKPMAVTAELGDPVPNVFREYLVDQRLIADVTAPRFLTEGLEHARINPNRD